MQLTGNNRAWLAETGSHMTAHTPIQSSQTGETVLARKVAVSAGNLDGIARLFRSPQKLAVSWAYCRLPVSAFKNSVPGGAIFTDPYTRRPSLWNIASATDASSA